MVSDAQTLGLIMAALIPLTVIVLMYLWIQAYSKRVETGMIGALGYGFLGYLWQVVLYMFAYIGVAGGLKKVAFFRDTYFGSILTVIILAICFGIFYAISLYWGVFLTNDKQKSLYRSATIGIGFGIGYTAWTYITAYGIPVKTVWILKFGNGQVDAATKAKVMELSVANMYMFAINSVLMIILFVGVTLYMGDLYLKKKKLKSTLFAFVVLMLMNLFNTMLPVIFPGISATILFYLVVGLADIYAIIVLVKFMTKGVVSLKFWEKKSDERDFSQKEHKYLQK